MWQYYLLINLYILRAVRIKLPYKKALLYYKMSVHLLYRNVLSFNITHLGSIWSFWHISFHALWIQNSCSTTVSRMKMLKINFPNITVWYCIHFILFHSNSCFLWDYLIKFIQQVLNGYFPHILHATLSTLREHETLTFQFRMLSDSFPVICGKLLTRCSCTSLSSPPFGNRRYFPSLLLKTQHNYLGLALQLGTGDEHQP